MKTDRLKQLRRHRRKSSIRKRVFGTSQRPRLTVYRSLKQIYAQIIDDLTGKTLVSSNSVQAKLPRGSDTAAGAEIGRQLARKAQDVGIQSVAFDRNGFAYHGRIKALADAARKEGLRF